MIPVRAVFLGVKLIADMVDVGVGVSFAAKDRLDAGFDFSKDRVHDDAVSCDVLPAELLC